MILTGEEFQQIRAQAEIEYPAECCGAILVKDGPPEERIVRSCRNIQGELHARQPEKHPRTARTAFHMHPEDYRAVDELVAKGFRPIIYHSHIDAGAYFSATDKERALFDGQPLYPDATYVVVSVVEGKVAAVAAFAWDGARKDFTPVELPGLPL